MAIPASSTETAIIPDTIEQIETYAFAGCTSLKKIDIPRACIQISAFAFASCTSLKQVDIPRTCKKIGMDTFYGCTSLEKVKLPASLEIISEYAFADCTSLKEITLPANLKTIAVDAFDMGVICDEAGDCSEPLVTSVEYVRCRILFRQAIGRLKLLTPRISPERDDTRRKPVRFSDGV